MLVAAALVSLVCEGSGTRRNLYNNQQYTDSVRVELHKDGGRIQLPPAMLPPEFRGGDEGWYVLRDFTTTEAAYRGRVRINIINSASVQIDRISGTLRIDGGQSGFSGICREAELKPLF